MTRRCSHCSHNGHNSRTCPNHGPKLFGVRLTDGSFRKSASLSNLNHYTGPYASLSNLPGSPGDTPYHGGAADGYGSEDFVGALSSSRQRKKGTPRTEEEHRMFLLGLQKLGKGDWRGISRNYVISRTPTQVASHAQKYVIRLRNASRRNQRSSLFDMVADEPIDTHMGSHDFVPVSNPQAETEGENPLPSPPLAEECESMECSNSNEGENAPQLQDRPQLQETYPVIYPAYYTYVPCFPLPFLLWPGNSAEPQKNKTHKVLKPTAVHSKTPINVDELVGMSKLSLGESTGDAHQPPSLKIEGSSRQSAFHPNPVSASSTVNSSSCSVHAS